jgi:4-cresol dehydrogenase (hydroxylating)
MNRIIEFDAELGYVNLEAGVSQGELYRYLIDHNLPYWMDATAAGPDASIVGNTLDRGSGHTRYGDRSLFTCGMTVVLPDGRVLKTGFGHYSNSKASHVYRNGVGPWLDGLFFQSNYGIVTEMGLWLAPKPESYSAFFITTPHDSDLEIIVERLGELKRQGLLPSAIHIANDLRLISNRARYPWAKAEGRTPLPAELRAEMREQFQIGAWTACGAIYGTKDVVRAIEKAIAAELKGLKPVFLNDKKLKTAERIANVLGWFGLGKSLREKIASAKPVFDLITGVPTHEAVHSGEWRLKPLSAVGAVDEETIVSGRDPLTSDAGLIWVSPILPMTARAARDVIHIMDQVYGRHGFDTLMTLTMITDRAFVCVSNIAFDKRDKNDVAKAKACQGELYDALIDAGYIPYRSSPTGFAKLSERPSVFWDFSQELKQAIDPNSILSPGRYVRSSTTNTAQPTPTTRPTKVKG